MSTWTGPWRVIDASKQHVYQEQNIINGEVSTAHVARIKFYKDSSLGITADIKESFQYLLNQGLFDMELILEIRRTPAGIYEVHVQWQGFSEEERSWEPLENIFKDAPAFIKKNNCQI